jgi:hypothetical protein
MTQSDHRKALRFELRLPIELVRSGGETFTSRSETRNVSSGGVLFSCESQLPVGQPIEYVLTFPTGKEANSVRLHCMGTVIRLEARPQKTQKDRERPFNVAVTLDRYEFVRREP